LPETGREILEHIGVTYHHKNIVKFINSLIDDGYLVRTIPDKPHSSKQKYVVRHK